MPFLLKKITIERLSFLTTPHKRYLVTGGAGFVGSHLCIKLKQHFSSVEVIAFDNLKRRGSELNLARLREHKVQFIHGDIRNIEDLQAVPPFDCLIDCAAEPSVSAGYQDASQYVLNTNLGGTINSLEVARKYQADFIFLSTSRVYPIAALNGVAWEEKKTRFAISEKQSLSGVSSAGINENFPLPGARSLYGASKLCSEYIIQEYLANFGLRGVINRCGVITGPWQMGKIDQGVIVLWVARHFWKGNLSYLGYQGSGKQVRDVLHIDDLFALLQKQLSSLGSISGKIFNVGGGEERSLSLRELTKLCQEITGNEIPIGQVHEEREGDIRMYITDNAKVTEELGWTPQISCLQMLGEIHEWICQEEKSLVGILS